MNTTTTSVAPTTAAPGTPSPSSTTSVPHWNTTTAMPSPVSPSSGPCGDIGAEDSCLIDSQGCAWCSQGGGCCIDGAGVSTGDACACPTPLSTGAIVGIAVGVVVIIAIGLFFFCRWRRSRSHDESADGDDEGKANAASLLNGDETEPSKDADDHEPQSTDRKVPIRSSPRESNLSLQEVVSPREADDDSDAQNRKQATANITTSAAKPRTTTTDQDSLSSSASVDPLRKNQDEIDRLLSDVEGFCKTPDELAESVIEQLASAKDDDVAYGPVSTAGRVVNKLSSVIPPPFNAPLAIVGSVFSCINHVVGSRTACIHLSRRLASLTPAVVTLAKLSTKKPQLTSKISQDLLAVFQDALDLIKKMTPSAEEQNKAKSSHFTKFCGMAKRFGQAFLNPAEEFEKIHNKINTITNDFQFASAVSAQDTELMRPAPNPDELRSLIREELECVDKRLEQSIEGSTAETVGEIRLARDGIQGSIKDLSAQIAKLSGKIDDLDSSVNALNLMVETQMKELTNAFEKLQKQDKYKHLFFNYDPTAIRIHENHKLGEGGSGTVFAATMRGKQIAAKRLKADTKRTFEQQAASICHEAKYIDQANLPNVIRQYGILVRKPYTYLLLEKCVCQLDEFYEVLGAELKFAPRIYYAINIASVLSAVHPKGVVFSDLKPANVLIHTSGEPRLSDFGSVFSETSSTATSVAASGVTASFAAPELRHINSRPTAKSDVFAFGITLFEIVTGTHFYYPRLTVEDIGNREVLNLIKRCIQENPEDRPDMPVVQDRLQEILMSSDDSDVGDIDALLASLVLRYRELLKQRGGGSSPNASSIDADSPRVSGTALLTEHHL